MAALPIIMLPFLDIQRVLDPLLGSILATLFTQTPVDFRGCHQHRETLTFSFVFHKAEYLPKTKLGYPTSHVTYTHTKVSPRNVVLDGFFIVFCVITFRSFSSKDRDPFTGLENSYLGSIFLVVWGFICLFCFCFYLFVFKCFKFLGNPLLLI